MARKRFTAEQIIQKLREAELELLGLPSEAGERKGGRENRFYVHTWDYDKTGAKEPPYNIDALCVFLEINTRHYRCVKAKAGRTPCRGVTHVPCTPPAM